MKFDNHILVIIYIVSLVFVSIKASNSSPSPSEDDRLIDEVKWEFGPLFDEAQEALGPISSLDIDEVEEAFSPSLNKAKEALGPVSSWDEAKEALGPVSSWDEAKEALGPVSSSFVDDAKEALSPISPSAIDEAKEAFGPASSELLDKAKEGLEDISKEAQKEVNDGKEAPTPNKPSASSGFLDEAKEKFGSLVSFITQDKEQISSLLEEAQEEFGPISSLDFDEAKDALPPISPSTTDNVKDALASDSSIDFDKAKEALPPISPSTVNEVKDALDSISPDTKQKFNSIVSFISQNKEEVLSSNSSPILAEAQKDLGPISSSVFDAPSPSPTSGPVSLSTLDEAKHAMGSISSKALDAAKEGFNSISSLFSQSKVEISSESNKQNSHSPSVYFDHDVALAIESLIIQAQSNSQLAIEEAQNLLSDTTSNSGKCLKKCMENYASCVHNLDNAMEALKGRKADLLFDDVSAVEEDISDCQKCFVENREKQSPLKDLEDAIVKATRECLNVLDHSG